MSPRKAALAKAPKVAAKPAPAKPAARTPVRAVAKPAEKGATAANGSASADATRLAAEIERGLKAGKLDMLTPQAFQALMAALCKSYGTQREAGAEFLPIANRTSVSPTEIMTITSGLLRAANLAVFELGMWQSWTGR
jgi:hypothetical protein